MPPKSYLYDYDQTTAPPSYNPTTAPAYMKPKRKKPYLSCTWYPVQCDAVGCDCGQRPCRDYKED